MQNADVVEVEQESKNKKLKTLWWASFLRCTPKVRVTWLSNAYWAYQRFNCAPVERLFSFSRRSGSRSASQLAIWRTLQNAVADMCKFLFEAISTYFNYKFELYVFEHQTIVYCAECAKVILDVTRYKRM